MKNTKIIFMAMLLGLLTVAACTTQGNNNQPGNSQNQQSGGSNYSPGTGQQNIKVFNIVASQFQFDPATLTVNKGDTVKLHLTSSDVAHGIAIPDFKISQRFEPGDTPTVEFIADKSGTFVFFCNVPCGSGHREMKGTLIVN